MRIRTYSELMKLDTFEERFKYLKLNSRVGVATFGSERYLNQNFYLSREWRTIRDRVIVRDGGMDLGCDGHNISGIIVVHHMNPISIEDIEQGSDLLLSEENLISVSDLTHKAIHYSDEELLPRDYVPRRPFDTCPWKGGNL